MKVDIASLVAEKFADCKEVAVCANLPYYITSPLIMRLLEEDLPIQAITVMVQKEAADRICAEMGTRECGAVTAAVRYHSEPEIMFQVNRDSFLPPPKVDSAVIRLKIRKEAPCKLLDEKKFFRFVAACFAERRKTLVNTVSSSMGTDKALLREALSGAGLEATVRSEALTMEELATIFNYILKEEKNG